MGTDATTIYMIKFENTNINTEMKNECFFYARYIDDAFIIYMGGEAKLNNFRAHPSIY